MQYAIKSGLPVVKPLYPTLCTDDILDMPCFFEFTKHVPPTAYPELWSGNAAMEWERTKQELEATTNPPSDGVMDENGMCSEY